MSELPRTGSRMVIDNASLLIAIAFSSGSLMIALLIGWMNSRRESYLLFGAGGIGLVVIAMAAMGLRNGAYDMFIQLVPFVLLLIGFALIYAGSRIFRDEAASTIPALVIGMVAVMTTAVPIIVGLSGIGTIMLNIGSAVLMLLCGREYWRSRKEARGALIVNAVLYTLTAISFACCALVLLLEGRWVLDGPPNNWAEDFNSIMSLVGLTGIGAITLTLHHARNARHHRMEAHTDALTGVLNRRALFDIYPEGHIATGLAVLMFDLDHFKQINDRLGHAAGDHVLQQFADVMREELRAADTIARLGGEEFCVIMRDMDGERAKAIAERIRTRFAGLNLSRGQDGQVATVSAGLAVGGQDEPFSSVLSRADAALYKAKSAGRNQVHIAALRLVA